MKKSDIQEIDLMIEKAREAQLKYEKQFNQEDVDIIIKHAAKVIYDNAEELAKMAIEETKMGCLADKISKNKNKSKGVWHNLKDKKSMGIIEIEENTNLIKIAKPIGVVAGVTPMTNPIVTPMTKIIFALKTKNAIIISPHPKAKQCSTKAVEYIIEAIKKFNVPENIVQIVKEPTLDKTLRLMEACDVVVATGGMPMVKSAYSSGKPSFGVGAGNVQVIIDRDIDFNLAAEKIITGRTFDNGIICSGEQSFIYPEDNKDQVFEAFRNKGGYFVNEEEGDRLRKVLFDEDKVINKDIVGKDVKIIAELAKIKISDSTRVLIVEAKGIGDADVVCKEKMCPVLACFGYKSIEEAIKIAETNLHLEGNGHTAGIHSNNQANIILVGDSLSVSRMIVNAPCATTAGGSIQNGLAVTNTLGCGTWGNNSISENFTYKHLLNITQIAPLSARIKVPTDIEIWQ